MNGFSSKSFGESSSSQGSNTGSYETLPQTAILVILGATAFATVFLLARRFLRPLKDEKLKRLLELQDSFNKTFYKALELED